MLREGVLLGWLEKVICPSVEEVLGVFITLAKDIQDLLPWEEVIVVEASSETAWPDVIRAQLPVAAFYLRYSDGIYS